jgi:hypothetical protein
MGPGMMRSQRVRIYRGFLLSIEGVNMARRLNVLQRSYKSLTFQPSADSHKDVPGYPVIQITSWKEILIHGKLLRIYRSPGETGRRKGLKIPR